ncbi:hypothetical protein NDU88_003649 [Pleurodeles waltl]|uniref:Uncharacterized protein n=1 Tax=Pleurodeles waltl TaxID=8319 RepID=A0AAV7RDH4_PLEWA|nr:hypothetical protein NDU88_003649 [Pleurodeles waltl]
MLVFVYWIEERRGSIRTRSSEDSSLIEDQSPSDADPMALKLDIIRNAIMVTQLDLVARVDVVALELGPLREEKKKLSDRVQSTESINSEIQTQNHSLTKQVGDLTSRVKQLEGK